MRPSVNQMKTIQLDEIYQIHTDHLPTELLSDEGLFEKMWDLHPDEFHQLMIHGKLVKTPRWQQAYNKDYRYSGSKNNALPIPEVLQPFYQWSQQQIDTRLNGLLLNWYDGELDHYIGKHRDSIQGLEDDSPIVTISFGERRVFRMRPWKGKGYIDIPVENGSVVVIPFDTNQAWTHEVPNSKRLTGKRISLTIRAFK